MPKKEVPVDQLHYYLPSGTGELVTSILHQYKVHLTIARERKSVLGDYRHPTAISNHRISVNGNLNVYAFLITLLHELAHLLTFEQYHNKVAPHGREWKNSYARLLDSFITRKIFPSQLEKELIRSLKDPAASSCAEEGLMRILRSYDKVSHPRRLLEELVPGTDFRIANGRKFRKGVQLRKRFRCTEINTGKIYLFSPVYEVEAI